MNSEPMISIRADSYNYYISIGRAAVQMLGSPEYICILCGTDKKSIAITPRQREHVMSVKIPTKFYTGQLHGMKIHSKKFVTNLISANNLELMITHNIKGRYIEEKNAIIFPLKML